MASAVDSRLAYARLSAVATASRLPTANRGSNNSYTTSWDTTRLKGYLPKIIANRTLLSRRFHIVVDVPGQCRSGSSSQIIDQAQQFLRQASWNGDLAKSHVTYWPWLTNFVPIFINVPRGVMSDECSTSFGKVAVRTTLAGL